MKTFKKKEQEEVTFEALSVIQMLHVRGGDGETIGISNPPPPPPPLP